MKNSKKIQDSRFKIQDFWIWPILVLGGLLRFYNNTAVALWHDEAFSALYLRYSWGEMMHRIGLDVHPPLYYWVLKLWSVVFGDGLLALRSLSIFFGILTIYAGFLFVRKAFGNEKLAIIAALFIAINPFQIQYALEARMYTMGTFLILISSWLLLKALEENKYKYWICFALAAAAGLYTHYFMIFSIAAQGLYVIYVLIQNRTFNYKAIGSFVLAGILYLPWVPQFLIQIKRVDQAFWITPPDRWSIPATIFKMAFGGQGNDHTTLVFATLAAIIIIFFFFKETKPPIKWLIILSIAVPFVLAVAMTIKQAIYQDRYFVFTSLFFIILVASSMFLLPKYTTRRAATAIFTIISLILFFKNWSNLEVKNLIFNRSINFKPGMAAASTFINDNARESDQIYVGSSFVYFTFKYYNHTPIKPLLYSPGSLESIPHFSGTALLENNDLITDFKLTNENSTVWLLWTTGFGGSKPNVPGNWSIITEKEYADTPGFKGNIMITQYHVN